MLLIVGGKLKVNSCVFLQNFVDLAGSERASHITGARLKEGCHINRSLLTLGTVIRKLRLTISFLFLLVFSILLVPATYNLLWYSMWL